MFAHLLSSFDGQRHYFPEPVLFWISRFLFLLQLLIFTVFLCSFLFFIVCERARATRAVSLCVSPSTTRPCVSSARTWPRTKTTCTAATRISSTLRNDSPSFQTTIQRYGVIKRTHAYFVLSQSLQIRVHVLAFNHAVSSTLFCPCLWLSILPHIRAGAPA